MLGEETLGPDIELEKSSGNMASWCLVQLLISELNECCENYSSCKNNDKNTKIEFFSISQWSNLSLMKAVLGGFKDMLVPF